MINWRLAFGLGAFFIIVGVIYYLVQGTGATLDIAGVVMLILTGVAMTFGFAVMLRGFRGL